MSLRNLFGETTTTVSVSCIQGLASYCGQSAGNFTRNISATFSVSVNPLNSSDTFYVLQGSWENIAKLGKKLSEFQCEANGKTVAVPRVSDEVCVNRAVQLTADTGNTIGSSSNNTLINISDQNVQQQCTFTVDKDAIFQDHELNRECNETSCAVATDNLTSERAWLRKSQRKFAQNVKNYCEEYVEDHMVNDLPDQETDNVESAECDIANNTQSSIIAQQDENEIDMYLIESLITESEKQIMETEEGQGVYSSSYCNLSSTKQTVLDPNTKSYQCKKCVFASSDRNCVEEHIKRKHFVKDVKSLSKRCSVCNRCFRKRSDLVRHMGVHSDKGHLCIRCGQVFKTDLKLKAHIQTHKEDYVRPEFECSTCGKMYSTKYVLENHVKTVHKGESKKFRCDLCDKEFTQKGSMMTHRKVIHQGVKLYRCDKCSAEFNHSRLLKKHLQNVHKGSERSSATEEEFKCQKCDFTTTKKEYVREHVLRNHADKLLSCSVCDAKFSYTAGLNKHMKTHISICQCSVCNKVYKDPRSLENHIKTHDPNYVAERVQCDICNKTLTNKYVLKSHKRKEHGQGEQVQFSCSECGRSFRNKVSLKEHQMMHKGEKPWECKVCGKNFTYRTSLKSHMRRHSAESVHQCHVCGKSFKTTDCLRIHSVIHTDPERYKCHCGKGFAQKQAMIRHKRTHTGEKPFLCHLCPEAFNDTSILKRHLQGVHKTAHVPKHKALKPVMSMQSVNDQLLEAEYVQDATNVDNNHQQSEQTATDRSKVTTSSHALSLLAGLCAAADQAPGYTEPPRTQISIFAPSYNILPPESPSMPALIPVTQPSTPPSETSENLSTLVTTTFHAMQTGPMVPVTFPNHGDPVSKPSW